MTQMASAQKLGAGSAASYPTIAAYEEWNRLIPERFPCPRRLESQLAREHS
jgi:hypothetical protein